ncbi:MAG: GntR family transcriptional regulator, partial [Anaerolineae bacterium]
MFSQPQVRYVTKVDMVHSILRENIIVGNLKPGSRLLQKEIANELGVSEIPVREALRRLQAEGLVTIIPHCGAEVTRPDPNEYREVLTIRAVLEGFAARMAIPHLTPADIEKLHRIVEEMRLAIESKDYETYSKLNKEFHSTMYAACKTRKLQEFITEIWERWGRSQGVFQLSPDRAKPSLEEHEAILKAIEAKDGDAVELLVREH